MRLALLALALAATVAVADNAHTLSVPIEREAQFRAAWPLDDVAIGMMSRLLDADGDTIVALRYEFSAEQWAHIDSLLLGGSEFIGAFPGIAVDAVLTAPSTE